MVPSMYLIEDTSSPRAVLQALRARFRVQGTHKTTKETFYDTFDWRLFAKGYGLYTSSEAGRTVLSIAHHDAVDANRRYILNGAEVPGFAWDFPPGHLRDWLSPIIDVRRLLQLVCIETQSETLRILNEDDKTVARVQIQHGVASKPETKARPRHLTPLCRVLPVRGYLDDFAKATDFVEQELALQRTELESLIFGLQAVGLEPGSYSPKQTLALSPSMPAEAAGRAIHRLLLDTILRNEDGVRRDLDTEFLHDFRVATRRARCALAEMKHVFPAETVQYLREELKWLGTRTGPVRDMDVYLLKMDDYRAELPADARMHLEPLDAYLHRHHDSERRALIEALDSDRYRELVAKWSLLVKRRARDDASCTNASRPILSLASQRIWRTYRRVYKDGRAIDATTPAEALHELRIRCKRLRYLLEFFRSLYPPEPLQQLIGALKQLQDNLGDFNDFEVQQVKLQSFAKEMHAEGLASVESLIAIGSLVQYLRQRQGEERERFARCFKEFARRRQRRLFRELFKPESGDAVVLQEYGD